MPENILVALISFGLGSVATLFIKYILDKKREKSASEFEHKIRRYKSAMIFMNVYLKPDNMMFIRDSHPDITSKDNLKETLKAEYYEMLLYAPDDVIKNVRDFISSPSNGQFIKTVKSMRKDLWGKRTKLKDGNLEI
ncbi:hypothetical protein [Spongiimicrobium sp. 3-5]|uniref:hypothetical protein n=1 Tax=Spongiimicrobium sp. 3-5 TaxID=3332596 RepID=UPI00397FEB01